MATCETCPFAMTAESESVQNLGCLPSAWEAMEIKRTTGKNWCCHEDESRVCAGFVEAAKEQKLDYKTGELASYQSWFHRGEP